jgi:hypothetical protein
MKKLSDAGLITGVERLIGQDIQDPYPRLRVILAINIGESVHRRPPASRLPPARR